MIVGTRIEFKVNKKKPFLSNDHFDHCANIDRRRVTTEDIPRILNKYEQGFEIPGYNDTLQELKNMSKKIV